MTRSEFLDQYKDPRWQKLRLEIFQRDDFACRTCGDKGKTLNVHHRYYVKGRGVWDYPAFALVTLCKHCHGLEHNVEESGISDWEQAISWLWNGDEQVMNFIGDLAMEIIMAESDGVDSETMRAKIMFFASKTRKSARV